MGNCAAVSVAGGRRSLRNKIDSARERLETLRLQRSRFLDEGQIEEVKALNAKLVEAVAEVQELEAKTKAKRTRSRKRSKSSSPLDEERIKSFEGWDDDKILGAYMVQLRWDEASARTVGGVACRLERAAQEFGHALPVNVLRAMTRKEVKKIEGRFAALRVLAEQSFNELKRRRAANHNAVKWHCVTRALGDDEFEQWFEDEWQLALATSLNKQSAAELRAWLEPQVPTMDGVRRTRWRKALEWQLPDLTVELGLSGSIQGGSDGDSEVGAQVPGGSAEEVSAVGPDSDPPLSEGASVVADAELTPGAHGAESASV